MVHGCAVNAFLQTPMPVSMQLLSARFWTVHKQGLLPRHGFLLRQIFDEAYGLLSCACQAGRYAIAGDASCLQLDMPAEVRPSDIKV